MTNDHAQVREVLLHSPVDVSWDGEDWRLSGRSVATEVNQALYELCTGTADGRYNFRVEVWLDDSNLGVMSVTTGQAPGVVESLQPDDEPIAPVRIIDVSGELVEDPLEHRFQLDDVILIDGVTGAVIETIAPFVDRAEGIALRAVLSLCGVGAGEIAADAPVVAEPESDGPVPHAAKAAAEPGARETT